MNSNTDTGFFTEEQVDRCNMKTLATPIPAPFDGHHVMALMVYSANLGMVRAGLSAEKSKQAAVDYYCSLTPEKFVEAIESIADEPAFIATLQIQEWMHHDPEAVARAVEAIENGWEPGDPK